MKIQRRWSSEYDLLILYTHSHKLSYTVNILPKTIAIDLFKLVLVFASASRVNWHLYA